MDALPAFVTDDALVLVALLWLGSLVLLVFALRGWFAARAASRASQHVDAGDAIVTSSAEVPAAAEWYVGDGTLVDVRAEDPFPDRASRRLTAEDQQPVASATTEIAATAVPRDQLAVTLRTRLAERDASARALADLVRALYLDQSNFRFETLSGLSAPDRELALHLIDAWLAEPSAIDFWQALYAAVDPSAAATRASQDA